MKGKGKMEDFGKIPELSVCEKHIPELKSFICDYMLKSKYLEIKKQLSDVIVKDIVYIVSNSKYSEYCETIETLYGKYSTPDLNNIIITDSYDRIEDEEESLNNVRSDSIIGSILEHIVIRQGMMFDIEGSDNALMDITNDTFVESFDGFADCMRDVFPELKKSLIPYIK